MFSSLSLGILYFPCSVEVCLGYKLERMFKRKNHKAFCGWTNGTYS